MMFCDGVLHDQAAGRRLAGEGDLGDAGAAGERLAGLDAEAVDDVEHARGQQVTDELDDLEDRPRGLLGRLEHDAVAGGEGRGELPHGHEDREVPRDDLADDAERLVEVVRDGVLVDLAARTLLSPKDAREVAEVVDGEREVGGERLAHGLAVLPRLGDGERLEVRLDAVGDPVEDERALAERGLAPGGGGGVGGVEGCLDVLLGAPGDLAERLAVDRRDVLEPEALLRVDPVAADEVAVAVEHGDERVRRPGGA